MNGEERKAWAVIAPELAALGVLTTLDGLALELLASAVAEYRAARAEVAASGSTYWTDSDDGSRLQRQSPNVRIAADAFRRAKGMLIEFGMTPAARTKVSAVLESGPDPLEEFLGSHE